MQLRDEEPHEGTLALPPVACTFTVQSPGVEQRVEIAELPSSYPLVQPLPDGRVLFVGARANWAPDGPEQNAAIYGPEGDLELRTCMGDGIEHLMATSAGAVWAGYFDEGVYGNNGWGMPGPDPIGSPGLVQFSARLEVEWEFPGDNDSQQLRRHHPIDDCYAMNLDGDRVWAHYLSGFPIVRVDDEAVKLWQCRVSGATSLITDGERLALVGGYESGHDRVVLGRLDHEFAHQRTTLLKMPTGTSVPRHSTVFGRSDELHVFAGSEWFRVDLDAMS